MISDAESITPDTPITDSGCPMIHLAPLSLRFNWLSDSELALRLAEYQRVLGMLEAHMTPAAHTLSKQLTEAVNEVEQEYRRRQRHEPLRVG